MITNTPAIKIQNLIYLIRGKKVMLDSDLATIYGVKTKRLNEQMRRNIKRFPADFMFQLNEKEWQNLRSQFATANLAIEKRRGLPHVFTEHGAVMLASILSSSKAVATSVKVVRAFIHLQEVVRTDQELAAKIEKLEIKYDNQFQEVFVSLRELMNFSKDKIHQVILRKGVKE
jgi:hypothetical protein